MGSVRHEVRVHARADDVWALVGRPETIHEWFPGIVACTVDEADGVVTRTITTGAGLQMSERIVTCDRLLRRFQYRITASMFTFHQGTIDVIELADGESPECLIVYSTDAEPSVMALTIGGGTLGALTELKRRFEGQPAPTSVAPATRSDGATEIAGSAGRKEPVSG